VPRARALARVGQGDVLANQHADADARQVEAVQKRVHLGDVFCLFEAVSRLFVLAVSL
jgi:hypothetical protein